MNIPAVVLTEAFKTPLDEEPTRPDTQVSKLWADAARDLSVKLIQCSQKKQRCLEQLDVRGAKEAYLYAKELNNLAFVLVNAETFPSEMAATMRRQSIDRIVTIYEHVGYLFS